jgi:hypothetical protein
LLLQKLLRTSTQSDPTAALSMPAAATRAVSAPVQTFSSMLAFRRASARRAISASLTSLRSLLHACRLAPASRRTARKRHTAASCRQLRACGGDMACRT